MKVKVVVGVAAALVLVFAAAAVPAEKQEVAWPKKSTTIFVSITLPAVIQEPLAVLGALAYDPPVPIERKVCPNARFCWYFIPPCEPLRVYGSKARKLRLSLEDSYSAHLRLEGDFTPWIHSSNETCIGAVNPTSKPRLRFRNYALTILGPEESELPDKISVSVVSGVVKIDATPPDLPAHLTSSCHAGTLTINSPSPNKVFEPGGLFKVQVEGQGFDSVDIDAELEGTRNVPKLNRWIFSGFQHYQDREYVVAESHD